MLNELHSNYVDGHFAVPKGAARIDVLNPSRNAVISGIPDSPVAVVDEAVAAATAAQKSWARLAPIERASLLRQVAARIRANTDEIARAISEEQGKILGLAKVEANFTADYIDYMAEWARRIEGEIIPSDRRNETIFLHRQPIGVVAGILPWNFPFFLIARKMAPALLIGNTIVIKPSEETPNNAAMFSRLLAETDMPRGVFNLVFGRGPSVGQALASHPGVGMVSFTGSVTTGSAIMAAAARNITKVNLELGGKAPAIVTADADLELAAGAIKDSRIINSGQVCNCAERVYVDRKVADAFIAKLTAKMKASRFGDPLKDETVDMGPLINAAASQKVKAMVDKAVADGAEVVTGGTPNSESDGFFFEPTVIAGARQDMEIMRKEIFGPVVPVAVFDDLDQAIDMANDCEYGLTSSIYTRDLGAAMKASRELKFGETYVNRENFEAMQGFHAGQRKSGIGGADGKHGIYEYTTTHTVYIET
ncbi:MAG: aldehyde dehydrogenase [Devosia sp. 67-54]|uniref:aldehyde dehydrogenase n=1 Tax=unclassified Devosia TaxID=196773 RepID=UPI00095E71CA|nr:MULTISPECIES: aldehyde dehydrogenase [unclassified Devosia]OJX15997.1 MAG: aldehyde dehydrogenase [Devosia sp. 67-54]